METLSRAVESVGITPGETLRARFARYFEMIEEANSRFNLTGAKGWERVRDELFIRSMRFIAPAAGGYVPASEWLAGRRVLDVGAGAGIPGMVLKLLEPEMRLTLLDSSAKKTAFLRDVVRELGLEDVRVVTGRAEEAGRDLEHRESYDLVVSRGVARLAELAELTIPFAAIGGTVITAKGPDVEAEIAEAEWACSVLGAAGAVSSEVTSPGDAAPDTLVYWMKVSPTPAEYPRRNGVPHSNPLVKPSGAARAADRR